MVDPQNDGAATTTSETATSTGAPPPAEKPEPKPVRAKEQKPCGCIIFEMDDGSERPSFCLGDLLILAGNAAQESAGWLQQAGQLVAKRQEMAQAKLDEQRLIEKRRLEAQGREATALANKAAIDRAVRGR